MEQVKKTIGEIICGLYGLPPDALKSPEVEKSLKTFIEINTINIDSTRDTLVGVDYGNGKDRTAYSCPKNTYEYICVECGEKETVQDYFGKDGRRCPKCGMTFVWREIRRTDAP
jgi:DNA-directed RNA polymerase subunit RPC12/RpoP